LATDEHTNIHVCPGFDELPRVVQTGVRDSLRTLSELVEDCKAASNGTLSGPVRHSANVPDGKKTIVGATKVIQMTQQLLAVSAQF
jgi:hypothetical protein